MGPLGSNQSEVGLQGRSLMMELVALKEEEEQEMLLFPHVRRQWRCPSASQQEGSDQERNQPAR